MQEKLILLRERLKDCLPDDLNTDFNLNRWLTAYDQDIDRCCLKFKEYLKIRKALGYDKPYSINDFYLRENVQKYSRFLTQSRISVDWSNSNDNALVFVEMPFNEPKKIPKVIRMSEYIKLFFGYCETFQKAVLMREKQTGKPSYGICIYDQKDISYSAYLSPTSAVNKMLSARVRLWMDYYSELLKQVIIINPPVILPLVWKVASVILPDKVHNRFCFAKTLPDQMLPYLSLSAIPITYGGKYQPKGNMPNGCNQPATIEDSDLQKNGQIWKDYGLAPVYKQYNISSNDTKTLTFPIHKDQCLLYEYTAKTETEFCINQDGIDLTPRLRFSTPKLSEEGKVTAIADGDIQISITNCSRIFSLKIDLAVHIMSDVQ
uniref:CRAL-TRIO domain-containing protein n=1 Tax=Syphacia muris TaxID=451379 RepID=A0A0N5ASF2_9BILA